MGNPRNRARKVSRKRKIKQDYTKSTKEKVPKLQKLVVDERSNDDVLSKSSSPISLQRNRSSEFSSTLSRSAIKVKSVEAIKMSEEVGREDSALEGIALFDLSLLGSIFDTLSCPACKNIGINFAEHQDQKKGLCIAFDIVCTSCHWRKEFYSSKRVSDKTKHSWEINVRTVMTFQNIGCGYEDLKSFLAIMNMGSPMTRNNYGELITSIHQADIDEADQSMKVAAAEVKEQTGSDELTASFNGTWQKPGHASFNGVVSAISHDSGKVLDFAVRPKNVKHVRVERN